MMILVQQKHASNGGKEMRGAVNNRVAQDPDPKKTSDLMFRTSRVSGFLYKLASHPLLRGGFVLLYDIDFSLLFGERA